MTAFIQQMTGVRRHWRLALLLLCLLATGTVQLAAATHWHKAGSAAADEWSGPLPAGDSGAGHGGSCLLCQVAAHASAAAPPPAAWALADATQFHTVAGIAPAREASFTHASHSWQGRAPPR
jgi:hypothetical protein